MILGATLIGAGIFGLGYSIIQIVNIGSQLLH